MSPGRAPTSPSTAPSSPGSVSGVQPIFVATERIAPYWLPCSPCRSSTRGSSAPSPRERTLSVSHPPTSHELEFQANHLPVLFSPATTFAAVPRPSALTAVHPPALSLPREVVGRLQRTIGKAAQATETVPNRCRRLRRSSNPSTRSIGSSGPTPPDYRPRRGTLSRECRRGSSEGRSCRGRRALRPNP